GGTPTVSGIFTFTLTATIGTTPVSQHFTLTVRQPALAFTTPPTAALQLVAGQMLPPIPVTVTEASPAGETLKLSTNAPNWLEIATPTISPTGTFQLVQIPGSTVTAGKYVFTLIAGIPGVATSAAQVFTLTIATPPSFNGSVSGNNT